MPTDKKMEINSDLHRRLIIQARNLLLPYRLAAGEHRGFVPCEDVQGLMVLYGNLIAQLIYEDQERAQRAENTRLLTAITSGR